MSEIDWVAESQRFDAVAALYDANRPGYPDELIATLITATGLQRGDQLLEIGSGTGKATQAFAGRGYYILCLEPGSNLAAVASHKFKDLLQVSFEQSRFEDWESKGRRFDLVMSAQAFHWIPEDIGYTKAACALKTGGHLALFWNMYPYIDSLLRRDLDQVYLSCAPEIAADSRDIEANIARIETAIRASGVFEAPQISRFPWSKLFTTQSYLGLLNTFSDHLRLDEDRRNSLLTGIAAVIEKHGGRIQHNYLAVLFIARKLTP